MISVAYIHVGILKGNPITRVIVLTAGKHAFFFFRILHTQKVIIHVFRYVSDNPREKETSDIL